MKISRRNFLGTAAVSAGLTKSGFYCHLTEAATDQKKSKNGKLGVMLVGCGSRGRAGHIPGFVNNPNTEVLYLSDPDPVNAEKTALVVKKLQGSKPQIITDFREALTLGAIDIVTVATPNHWHALCGILAMKAGKDVYLEKPMSHNLYESRALVAAAKENGRICQIGTQRRSYPVYRDSFDFIAKGGIGEVKLVRGLCYKRRKSIGALGKYPIPENIDYNLWSGPAPIIDPMTRPNFHYDWHWQRLYGNGDTGNQGPHQTDLGRTVLGVNEFPQSIVSYGGRLGYPEERKDANYVDAGDTPNTQISIYNYANGKTLVFETRGLATDSYRGSKIGVIAYGSEGYWVELTFPKAAAYDLKGNLIKQFSGGSDQLHFDNFIQAVLDRTPEILNADLRCGQLSAGLSHLGNISYYLGEKNKMSPAEALRNAKNFSGLDDNVDTMTRTFEHLKKNNVNLEKTPISMGALLKFDVKNETFSDNADAKKMETRDYREGFVC